MKSIDVECKLLTSCNCKRIMSSLILIFFTYLFLFFCLGAFFLCQRNITSAKHQQQNSDQTSASKSRLKFNFKLLTKPCAASLIKCLFL